VPADDVDLHYLPLWSTMDAPESISGKFKRNFVKGNVVVASVLVSQAAFQTPHVVNKILPLPNIMLFLYLAKLIISSGLLQQYNLSKVLSILYPYADKNQEDWAPIPCTICGFRSLVLNVSNSSSLVSILPIPSPVTLPDGHGYTPFRSILKHALMMKTL
jgi:hypothetical protein